MSLPDWNTEGLLPEGRWPTDMDGIHQRFVLDAPNRQHREHLFSALQLFANRARALLGPATLWVDGGFSTNKAAAPLDVDVAWFPDDLSLLAADPDAELMESIAGSLTLQGVTSNEPKLQIHRLQPYAGLLDAFIGDANSCVYWHETWSRVKRDGLVIDHLIKGYAEVRI